MAILLPNGNVLVAGGEQGDAFSSEQGPWCGTTFDYTFEAEIYKRGYLYHIMSYLMTRTSMTDGDSLVCYLFLVFLAAPYVYKPELRPTIISIVADSESGSSSSEHRFGDTIRVHYEGPVVTGATITSPGAVTHGADMNSRTAFLEIVNPNDDDARRRRRDLRRDA